MRAASLARLTAGTAFATAGDGSSALTTVARRGRAASTGIAAEDRTWYVTVSFPPAASDPAFTPADSGFSPLMSAIGLPFRIVELGTYETCDGMTSFTTRLVAQRSDALLTWIVMVVVWPAASEVPPAASLSVSADASGEVRSACISIATGAMARSVIRAADPSTKNAVDENRPTASATPTTEARVRLGLRMRSRRLYLSMPHRRAIADHATVAQRHDAV